MKHINDEAGVVVVLELVLVALVLVLAGAAAFTAMNNKTRTATAGTTPSPHTSPLSSPTPTSAKASANEFNVPELEFKMTLPSGLAGLTYSLQLNQNGSTINGTPFKVSNVSFSTTALTNDDPSNCSASSGPLGSISELSFNPIGNSESASVYNTVQVGSDWLVYQTPQQPCSATNSVDKLETSLLPLMKQAFGTAAPLSN